MPYMPKSVLDSMLDNKDLSTDGVSRKIRELYNQIKISAEMDRLRWGYHPNSKEPDFDTYDEYVEQLEDCINTRLAAIKAMPW